MKIESVHNPKVKEWVQLKEKKYRDLENKFIIEGEHLVEEALKCANVLEIISTNPLLEVPNIPFYEVSDAIMRKLSSQVTSTNIMAIVEKLEEKEITGHVCLLDGIQDPGNLGTIIRSARAFHIDTIILSLDTVDLYNEKVIRSTEGNLFALNFRRMEIEEAISLLKKEGYFIYGTDVVNGVSLTDIAFHDKNAIIIGNEGRGMQEKLKSSCDSLLRIPINTEVESLNAGVAASIIFYEMSVRK